jgi:hypothetical protein
MRLTKKCDSDWMDCFSAVQGFGVWIIAAIKRRLRIELDGDEWDLRRVFCSDCWPFLRGKGFRRGRSDGSGRLSWCKPCRSSQDKGVVVVVGRRARLWGWGGLVLM